MARYTPIAELKARLSLYLDLVKGGTEVVVTERGRPVARILLKRADARRPGRAEPFVPAR